MFRVHGSPTLATTTRAGEVDQRVAGKNAWQASDVEFVTSKLADTPPFPKANTSNSCKHLLRLKDALVDLFHL